jgi:uncharacterized protein YqgC (DUF456 family)
MVTALTILLLIVVLLGCWVLGALGMPGNWLMVAVVALYGVLVPGDSPASLGWKTVVTLGVLAALGEILELVAGAAGTARLGGTRRGAAMALAGSVVGSILGMFVGLPVPVVGSLLAAVLFAALGATVGAIIGEIRAGQTFAQGWRIAQGAFWGRLTGTLGKLLIGAIMIAVVIAAWLI